MKEERWHAWVINRIKREKKKFLQSSSSRNDLNELLGDDGLAGSVEGQGQFLNNIS